jgi:hypothetical protein
MKRIFAGYGGIPNVIACVEAPAIGDDLMIAHKPGGMRYSYPVTAVDVQTHKIVLLGNPFTGMTPEDIQHETQYTVG